MPNGWILTLAAILGLIGLLMTRRALDARRVLHALRNVSWRRPAEAQEGLIALRGRLATQEPMTAPLTGRPAVYYMLQARREADPGRRAILGTHKAWTTSQIAHDGTAIALEPWTPLVASLHRDTARVDGLDAIPPEQTQLYEDLGIADKHLARIQPFTLVEHRLEPDDEVYVTGTYDATKGLYRAKRRPFVVSAQPDTGYRKGLRNELTLFAALPPMFFAAALIVAVLSFA